MGTPSPHALLLASLLCPAATTQEAQDFADPARRALAVAALAGKPDDAARIVHAAWATAAPEARNWLLLALGFAPAADAKSTALLVEQLAGKDLRRAAVRALVVSGEAAWPALLAALRRDPNDYWVAVCLAASDCPERALAVTPLIRSLDGDDGCTLAVRALTRLGAAAVPALTEAQRGAHAGRAMQARRALLNMENHAAGTGGWAFRPTDYLRPPDPLSQALHEVLQVGYTADSFLRFLADEDPARRAAALQLLGGQGSSVSGEPVAAIVRMLRDRETRVRLYAARALGRLGRQAGPEAVPALKDALLDREIAAEAAVALARVAPQERSNDAALRLALCRDATRLRAACALAARGTEPFGAALPALLEGLLTATSESDCLSALGSRPDLLAPAVPILARCLDPNVLEPHSATEVVRLLARIGSAASPAAGAVGRWAAHATPDARTLAVATLARIGVGAAPMPALTANAATSTNRDERRQALDSLSRLPRADPARVSGTLAALAADALALRSGPRLPQQTAGEVRSSLSAVAACGEAAAPRLLAMLESDDPRTRCAALFGLGSIGLRSDATVKALRDQLGGDDSVGLHAAWALGRLGVEDRVTLRALLHWLTAAHPTVDALLPRNVPRTLAELESCHPVCWAIVRAGVVAVPVLIEGLKGQDGELRRQSAELLPMLGANAAPAALALIAALRDPDPVIARASARALGALHKAPAPVVAALAEHVHDHRLRREAINSLVLLAREDAAALAPLLDALRDETPPYRLVECGTGAPPTPPEPRPWAWDGFLQLGAGVVPFLEGARGTAEPQLRTKIDRLLEFASRASSSRR